MERLGAVIIFTRWMPLTGRERILEDNFCPHSLRLLLLQLPWKRETIFARFWRFDETKLNIYVECN